MTIEELISIGFKNVGKLTTNRPKEMSKKKHGIYFIGNAPQSRGVYFLSKGDEIVKIGDAQGVDGLRSRINNYLANREKTNANVREALARDGEYEVFFFETKVDYVKILGMQVEKSILPRSLEKALIEKYFGEFKKLPRLNPINR